jgi:hypothetical protein
MIHRAFPPIWGSQVKSTMPRIGVLKTASHDAATFGAFERCMSSYRQPTEILKVHQDMRFLLIMLYIKRPSLQLIVHLGQVSRLRQLGILQDFIKTLFLLRIVMK